MGAANSNHSSLDFGETKITAVLRVEHRLLRAIMEAVAEWLSHAQPSAVNEMRAYSNLLGTALEIHALLEEQHLFAHIRPLSDRAAHLVDMMILVHDEVRGLLEEIQTMDYPKEHIWTILDLTEPILSKRMSRFFLWQRSCWTVKRSTNWLLTDEVCRSSPE